MNGGMMTGRWKSNLEEAGVKGLVMQALKDMRK